MKRTKAHFGLDTLTNEEETCCDRMIWTEYERNVRTGLQAMQRFREIAEEMNVGIGRWYWVTISPDPDGPFETFYNDMRSFVARQCVSQFYLTFEQRATDLEDLGRGHHAHMLCQTTMRSKGELIRAIASTTHLDPHFIDVDLCKNNDFKHRLSYITNYTSTDGHKELTLTTDQAWRDLIGLRPLYTDVPPPLPLEPPSRPMEVQDQTP